MTIIYEFSICQSNNMDLCFIKIRLRVRKPTINNLLKTLRIASKYSELNNLLEFLGDRHAENSDF